MNTVSTACPVLLPDGLHRQHDAVILARSIRADGERQGTLVIYATVPSMAEVLCQYLGGAALIIALSLVVAAILAVVLQSRVSAPILAIAQVAERISQHAQFEDRVAVASGDELGVLAESFNSMLDRNCAARCQTRAGDCGAPTGQRRVALRQGARRGSAPASRASSWPT